MKTTPTYAVTARHLRPAVTTLGKVVRKSRDASEPLCSIRIEAVGRTTLRFTATDGQAFLTIDLPSERDLDPQQSHPTFVSLENLRHRLKGARTNEVIEIRSRQSPDEAGFPDPPPFRNKAIHLDRQTIEAIQHAMVCSSKDPTRHVLQGALLDPTGSNRVCIVGTDGRHLFQSHELSIPGIREQAILLAHPVLYCPLIRKDPTWRLRLSRPRGSGSASRFQLSGENWSFTAPLIEGKYPNYQQVIPPTEKWRIQWEIPESHSEILSKVIAKIPRKDSAKSGIGLRTAGDTLRILVRDIEEDGYEELILPAGKSAGKNEMVFLNRDHLSHALRFGLRSFESEDASAPLKAVGEAGIMVLMPQRPPRDIRIVRSRDLQERERAPRREPTSVRRKAPKKAASIPRRQSPPRSGIFDEILNRLTFGLLGSGSSQQPSRH